MNEPEFRLAGIDPGRAPETLAPPLTSAFPRQTIERAKFARPLPPALIERCRQIYLGLSFPSGAETRVVGITSALRQEGRTSVAVGVATAMAADTLEPTLLLECDLEQPSFGNIFGFHSAPGLTEWLEGTAPLRLIRVVPLENEFVLPIGSSLVDPARIIYRLTQSSLMEQLRPRFRNVVIDLPPVVNLAYGALASKLADRVVLVVRHGVTPIEDLEKSIALLGKERLAGIVLNQEVLKTPAWIRRLL